MVSGRDYGLSWIDQDGLFGSLEYCFVYWKANEADTALDSVF